MAAQIAEATAAFLAVQLRLLLFLAPTAFLLACCDLSGLAATSDRPELEFSLFFLLACSPDFTKKVTRASVLSSLFVTSEVGCAHTQSSNVLSSEHFSTFSHGSSSSYAAWSLFKGVHITVVVA